MEYLVLVKCLKPMEAEILTDEKNKNIVFPSLSEAQDMVEKMNRYYADGNQFSRVVAM